jgi:protein-S-isoprenylcysteine O-methyltransferase Ste14
VADQPSLIVAAAAALTAWTLHALGRNVTDTVVTRQSHALVCHGPYRWVRHPLYLAVLILTTGLSLATANGFFFVMGGAILVLIAIRTHVEERHLVARFGAEYRAYMNRTGRFLPRLH